MSLCFILFMSFCFSGREVGCRILDSSVICLLEENPVLKRNNNCC